MKAKFPILGICFLITFSTSLIAENAVIIKQEESPIQIVDYEVSYNVVADGIDVISHAVKGLNTSEKKVVAIRYVTLVFSCFNEYFDTSRNYTMWALDPNKQRKTSWNQANDMEIAFSKFGTGIAFVDSVRFEDGTIWRANSNDTLPQIQEMQKSFTLELLEEIRKITPLNN